MKGTPQPSRHGRCYLGAKDDLERRCQDHQCGHMVCDSRRGCHSRSQDSAACTRAVRVVINNNIPFYVTSQAVFSYKVTRREGGAAWQIPSDQSSTWCCGLLTRARKRVHSSAACVVGFMFAQQQQSLGLRIDNVLSIPLSERQFIDDTFQVSMFCGFAAFGREKHPSSCVQRTLGP